VRINNQDGLQTDFNIGVNIWVTSEEKQALPEGRDGDLNFDPERGLYKAE
jgi:hypothetical protein